MKKLYRSRQDKMIAGVCAGVAEYYKIDSTLVRLAFVLLTLAYGGGLIAYIVCAIIIPEKPVDYVEDIDVTGSDNNPFGSDNSSTQKKTKQLIGIGLVILGVLVLFDKLFWWFDRGIILPIAIIAVGAFLLIKPSTSKDVSTQQETTKNE